MRYLLLIGLLVLGGCSQDATEDLKRFMADAGLGQQPALEPMPPILPVAVHSFDAANLADPFQLRQVKTAGGGANRPDLERVRGPLEEHPLDALRMVGTLSRGGQVQALIRTPNNVLYRVGKGHYLGQNHGRVTAISDTGIEIIELVQDGTGDWVESRANLALQE